MKKKPFHTKDESIDGAKVRFIAGEDFVEMGSIAGEQYFAAVSFNRIVERNSSVELFPANIKFLRKCIQDFCEKHRYNLSQRFPSLRGQNVELYKQSGEYSSYVFTLWNTYDAVWVRIEEISHQHYYHEFGHRTYTESAKIILEAFNRADELAKEYRTKSFYNNVEGEDTRD